MNCTQTWLVPQPDEDATPGAPLFLCPVAAGFPSPADDYLEGELNLHAYMVKNRQATFFLRACGDSMLGAGIHDGDLLVVDRSLTPAPGLAVIAALDGELTVKYLRRIRGRTVLEPANEAYPPLDVTDNESFMIWGVVTYVIHKLAAGPVGHY